MAEDTGRPTSRSASLHEVYSHPSAVEHWRHLIEIIAVVVAAVWAFYVFVYQEDIKPAHELPSLDVRSGISHEPLHRNKELVNITLVLKNIGSAAVDMNAMIINVYGLRFAGHAQPVRLSVGQAVFDDSHTLQPVTKALVWTRARSFERFDPGDKRRYSFLPGREKTTGVTFAVPTDQYDAVRIEYALCYGKDGAPEHRYRLTRGRDGAFDTAALDALNNPQIGINCLAADQTSAL